MQYIDIEFEDLEYVETKLDDILKYQKQENNINGDLKKLDQSTNDLVLLTTELSDRFKNCINNLNKKLDKLVQDNVQYQLHTDENKLKQLTELDEQQQSIDRNFKEQLRNISLRK